MYHRVAEVARDPWSLAVSPANFDEHLQVLAQCYRTAQARDLGSRMDDGERLPGTVFVTFDDGYVDNLQTAKPLLERWGIKATFFIPTGSLGVGHNFWWDELDRLLLEPGRLPAVIHVPSLSRSWHLDGDTDYPTGAAAHHRTWRPGQATPTRRHQVYEELWQLLVGQPDEQRAIALAELRAATGAPRPASPADRALTVEELSHLDAGELTEIGSHTVSHSALSALPPDEQRKEIEKSKATLEDVLGRPVESLSYPNGRFGPETPGLVQAAGYSNAFTTRFGLVSPGTDRFRIPRVVPPDVDGDGFARWMRGIVPPAPL